MKEQDYRKIIERLHNPKTTLSDDKLADLKKKVAESLSIDRQRLVCKQPFTGGMLMHFDIIPIRDYRCSTAVTDGSRLYFDIDFYSKLGTGERMFVLAHECWHCIFLHFLRQQGRKPLIWNIATDCEINQMLKEQGFKSPEDVCYPEGDSVGKSAEEIYEKLLEKSNNSEEEVDSDENNGGSDGNASKGKGGLHGQFDKHSFDDDSISDLIPKDEWGEKGIDKDYNPKIDRDAAEKIRESVISEAQICERQAGTLPDGIGKLIEMYRKPEISWKEVLCQEVTKCYSDRMEWLPPNRRYIHQGLYMQSRHGEKVSVTVIIDTSGSTTADLPKFMGELVGLLNSFSNYDMKLIQCDAAVQSVEKYGDFTPFPIDDCSKIRMKGFGGSNLNPAFDYLEKDNGGDEYPNMIIVFTDGFIDVPKNPPPANVLWVLTSDGDKDFCNYGRKILFKEKREMKED